MPLLEARSLSKHFGGLAAVNNLDLTVATGEIVRLIGPHGADQPPRNLPHGNQRRLGMAMAPAARPRLLLRDEPVTGMNLTESAQVMSLIKKIRDGGTTILLVEHNMKAVMRTCDRIVVLNFGPKLADVTPAAVSTIADVIDADLGAVRHHA